MANSLGGVIIFGITADPHDKTLPREIAPIDRKNIETIDRVINAQIRPPIRGLRRSLIPKDVPSVLILEVPPSEDPPHQSLYDKRYYRRSGTECLPMDHDLVALKFSRRLAPILELVFQSLSSPTSLSGDPLFSDEGKVRVFIKNDGRRMGRHVMLVMRLPPTSVVQIGDAGPALANIDALHPGLQARQFQNDSGVFHPGTRTSFLELSLRISETFLRERQTETLIGWILFADEMNPRSGDVSLKDLGWTLPATVG
jgi:hypothetical protein